MKISFVMPVYNCASFIAKGIRTLLQQNFKDYEIVIVDDCSNDGTWNVLSHFKDKHPNIRLFRAKVRSGAAVCRNLGNREALAPIICVTDAGDWYHQSKAKIVHNYFQKNKDIGLMHHSVEIITSEGKHMGMQYAVIEYDYLKNPRSISHPTVSYRKAIALRIPYREGCIHTDQYEAFFIMAHRSGVKFGYVEDVYLKKIDLSQTPNFRNIKEARKQKIKIYEEFGIPITKRLREGEG